MSNGQRISSGLSSGIRKPSGSASNRSPTSNDTYTPILKGETNRRAVYINIYESELSNIVGQAVKAGCIETGGQAFGLFTHNRRPVVMYTTVAGPNSVLEYSIFQQDSIFVKRVSDYLFQTFGIQPIARHHSHHEHHLSSLSPQDRHSNYLFASRNDFQELGEILVTFEDSRTSTSYSLDLPKYAGRSSNLFQKNREKMSLAIGSENSESTREGHGKEIRARVQAFMFREANKGKPPVSCPIRIIPGISPMREAINKNCPIPELKQWYDFPLSKIMYDAFEAPTSFPRLPSRIYRQCLQLPPKIIDTSKIVHSEGLTMLLLVVPEKGNLLIVFRDEKKHRISSVYFSNINTNGEKMSLTHLVLLHGPYTNVATVYETAAAYLSRKDSMTFNFTKGI